MVWLLWYLKQLIPLFSWKNFHFLPWSSWQYFILVSYVPAPAPWLLCWVLTSKCSSHAGLGHRSFSLFLVTPRQFHPVPWFKHWEYLNKIQSLRHGQKDSARLGPELPRGLYLLPSFSVVPAAPAHCSVRAPPCSCRDIFHLFFPFPGLCLPRSSHGSLS